MHEPRPKSLSGAGLASLLVSGVLLVALYRSLDVRLIGEALLRADPLWVVISVGMIVPITVLRAIRFYAVAPAGALPGVGEALRLTLVASALNVFMPAKAGDLVKSYFVARRSTTPAGVAVAIVVFERLCDLAGLIFWCLLGWAISRPQVAALPVAFWMLLGAVGTVCGVLILSRRAATLPRLIIGALVPPGKWRKLHDLADGWPALLGILRGRRRWIVLFSLVLWLGHLFQLWLFTIALSISIPFTVCATLSAVALMAGQLPLTVAGIGTRDVALVVLLAGYATPEAAAAMGVLVVTRNLLPPLLGLPIMRPYVSSVVDEARRWRRQVDAAR